MKCRRGRNLADLAKHLAFFLRTFGGGHRLLEQIEAAGEVRLLFGNGDTTAQGKQMQRRIRARLGEFEQSRCGSGIRPLGQCPHAFPGQRRFCRLARSLSGGQRGRRAEFGEQWQQMAASGGRQTIHCRKDLAGGLLLVGAGQADGGKCLKRWIPFALGLRLASKIEQRRQGVRQSELFQRFQGGEADRFILIAGVFQKHLGRASVATLAQGAQQYRFYRRLSLADLFENGLIHTTSPEAGERVPSGLALGGCALGRGLRERREQRGVFESRQRLPGGHPYREVRASGGSLNGGQRLRPQLEARIQYRDLRVRRQFRPLLHAGFDHLCVSQLADQFERGDVGQSIRAGQRFGHQVQALRGGRQHQSPPGRGTDLRRKLRIEQTAVKRGRTRAIATRPQPLGTLQERLGHGCLNRGYRLAARCGKRRQSNRAANLTQRGGGVRGNHRVKIREQRLEQGQRFRIMPSSERVNHADLEQTCGLAQRFAQGGNRLGRGDRFQSITCGVRSPIFGEQHGQSGHGSDRADDSQLKAGSTFIGHASGRLKDGDEFHFIGGTEVYGTERQQAGEQDAMEELYFH